MLPEKSARDESMCRMVERFCGAGQGNTRRPVIDDDSSNRTGGVSKHPVTFEKHSELQKWLRPGTVDFAEIFRGYGELTIRVREAGCSASEGFDEYAVTYERCWFLETEKDQCDCVWLLVYCFRAKVIHCGTPCTKMCRLVSKELGAATIK